MPSDTGDPPLPLFTYGTLLDPEFLARLLERPVESAPARLLDFELLDVEGLPLPTVFDAPGETVSGRLYRGLGAADYERLDAYEGVAEDLYRSVIARVIPRATAGEAAPEPARVYVVTEKTLARYGVL